MDNSLEDAHSKISAAFKRFVLTKRVPKSLKKNLLDVMYPRLLEKGQVLLNAGETATSFYVVQSGQLLVKGGTKLAALTSPDLGRPKEKRISPGGCCGHSALLSGGAENQSIIALEPTLVWELQAVLYRSLTAVAHRERRSKSSSSPATLTAKKVRSLSASHSSLVSPKQGSILSPSSSRRSSSRQQIKEWGSSPGGGSGSSDQQPLSPLLVTDVEGQAKVTAGGSRLTQMSKGEELDVELEEQEVVEAKAEAKESMVGYSMEGIVEDENEDMFDEDDDGYYDLDDFEMKDEDGAEESDQDHAMMTPPVASPSNGTPSTGTVSGDDAAAGPAAALEAWPTEEVVLDWVVEVFDDGEWMQAKGVKWIKETGALSLVAELEEDEVVEVDFVVDFGALKLVECKDTGGTSADLYSVFKSLTDNTMSLEEAQRLEAERKQKEREEKEELARQAEVDLVVALEQRQRKWQESQPQQLDQQSKHRQPPQDVKGLERVYVLGKGAFGTVWLVRQNPSEDAGGSGGNSGQYQYFAMKQLSKKHVMQQRQEKHIERERRVMALLSSGTGDGDGDGTYGCGCPFVVRLYCTGQDSSTLLMVQEWMQGGELYRRLHPCESDEGEDLGQPLALKDARFYASIVALVWGHIHPLGIVYRDLKPENLLLDTHGYLKFADWGFAKVIGMESRTYTFCGSPEYLAPEIIRACGHDRGVDLWSLGVLLYEMLVGFSPFLFPAADTIVNAEAAACAEGHLRRTCSSGAWSNARSGASSYSGGSAAYPTAPEISKRILLGKFIFPTHPMEAAAKKENDDGDANALVLSLKECAAVEEHKAAEALVRGLLERRLDLRAGYHLDAGSDANNQLKAHPFFKDVEWAKLQRRQVQPPWEPPKQSISSSAIPGETSTPPHSPGDCAREGSENGEGSKDGESSEGVEVHWFESF
jgi:serine/threonine protein kinase/CRP-like cAMP-binding protein